MFLLKDIFEAGMDILKSMAIILTFNLRPRCAILLLALEYCRTKLYLNLYALLILLSFLEHAEIFYLVHFDLDFIVVL